jgi:hypothetical protein
MQSRSIPRHHWKHDVDGDGDIDATDQGMLTNASERRVMTTSIHLIEIEPKSNAIDYVNASLVRDKPLSRFVRDRIRVSVPRFRTAVPMGTDDHVQLTHALCPMLRESSEPQGNAARELRLSMLGWLVRKVGNRLGTVGDGALVIEDTLGKAGDAFLIDELGLSICEDSVYCIVPILSTVDSAFIQHEVGRMENAFPPIVGIATRYPLKPLQEIPPGLMLEAVAKATVLIVGAYDGDGYLVGEWDE